jgi:O-antigen/teichoic acid export membrane protein
VSPLMGYMDRFLVAAAVSATAVAYYAAPQEVVVRMGTVSGAVMGVLFPAFAAAGAADRARLPVLLERGAETVFVLVFPLALGMVAFASEGLGAWLGPGFAREGAAVLRWFGVGLLAGGLAKPPAALVTAIGRPDLTARLHLAELPLYLGFLLAVVPRWGIQGAAVVWAGRAAFDALGMYWLAARVAPGASAALRRTGFLAAAGAAALGTAALIPDLLARTGWVAILLGAAALYARRRFGGASSEAPPRA